MSRWEKELRQRLEDVKPSPSRTVSDDDFDRVFGEKIEQTLSEYRLMVMELIGIKFWLRGALKTFWALSAVLVVAVAFVAFNAQAGRTAAERNGKLLDRLDDHIAKIETEVQKFNSGNPVYVKEHQRTQRLICAVRASKECSKVEGR